MGASPQHARRTIGRTLMQVRHRERTAHDVAVTHHDQSFGASGDHVSKSAAAGGGGLQQSADSCHSRRTGQ
jgi:hypothetical protein